MSMSSLVTLMICHLVFDWLLQDRETATNKSHNIKYLLPHVILINAGILIWGLFFTDLTNKQVFIFALSNSVLHAIIDWNIWKLYAVTVVKRFDNLDSFTYWNDRWFYNFIAFDQLLHGLCYIVIYFLLNGGAT